MNCHWVLQDMHEPELGCGICGACARELWINARQVVVAKIACSFWTTLTANIWYNVSKPFTITALVLHITLQIPHLSTLYHVDNTRVTTCSANTNFVHKWTLVTCGHQRVSLRCADLETKMIESLRSITSLGQQWTWHKNESMLRNFCSQANSESVFKNLVTSQIN